MDRGHDDQRPGSAPVSRLATAPAAIGVSTRRRPVTGWEGRLNALERSDDILRSAGLLDQVAELEQVGWQSRGNLPASGRFTEARRQLWSRIANDSESIGRTYAWLRLNAVEEDALLAASASAALSHFRAPSKINEYSVPVPFARARRAIEAMVDSSDDLVSEIAQASTGREAIAARASSFPAKFPRTAPEEMLSLMVHGTHAWGGSWWFPGGDFHQYVKAEVRPSLYDEHDCFSWSGMHKGADRKLAAERLAGWLSAKGSLAVDTVFAHSYGGAVALMSTMHGISYRTAVLLSVPVHQSYEVEWRNIDRAISVRIHCDLVLLAARAKQRFTANVEDYCLDEWFVSHASSHDPQQWIDHKLSEALHL
jgi:hypothetical protein